MVNLYLLWFNSHPLIHSTNIRSIQHLEYFYQQRHTAYLQDTWDMITIENCLLIQQVQALIIKINIELVVFLLVLDQYCLDLTHSRPYKQAQIGKSKQPIVILGVSFSARMKISFIHLTK